MLAVVVRVGLQAIPPVLALLQAGTGSAYLGSLAEQREPDGFDVTIFFT